VEMQKLAKRLVALCNDQQFETALQELYADDIVSIEADGSAEMPARLEGIDAVRQKGDWWAANHDVHAMRAEGPFIGHRADQFVVRFELDLTPKGGARTTMTEVGVYTVRDGKVAQEEFLYLR
jgi:hypothetical protein